MKKEKYNKSLIFQTKNGIQITNVAMDKPCNRQFTFFYKNLRPFKELLQVFEIERTTVHQLKWFWINVFKNIISLKKKSGSFIKAVKYSTNSMEILIKRWKERLFKKVTF